MRIIDYFTGLGELIMAIVAIPFFIKDSAKYDYDGYHFIKIVED